MHIYGMLEAINFVSNVTIAQTTANVAILVWSYAFFLCTQVKNYKYIKPDTMPEKTQYILRTTVFEICTWKEISLY